MAEIAVFGGANMDVLGFPQGEARLRDSNIGRVRFRPGGVGRNIAEQICALGCRCELLTAFGADLAGQALRAACEQAGIGIAHALLTDGPSCVYLCVHDAAGDMLTAVNDMGLTARLDADYVRRVLPVIDASALCVLDGNPPAETLALIAANTRAPLLMDPTSVAKLDRAKAVLPRLAAIKPNIHEARALTGCQSAADCAKALVKMGAKRVFVSLGGEGLCCADAQGCFTLPVKERLTVPATGAGDALCAGLAVALANGEKTRTCAEEGMRAAASFLKRKEEQLCSNI
ncbi:MAG: carbohydrate kinase family protein [Clostridia bacterium]|nr:carbohydrate kinase family protein [Clostridia bacterium]